MGTKPQQRIVTLIVISTLIVCSFFIASGVTRLAASRFLPLEDAPPEVATSAAPRPVETTRDDTAILRRNIFYGVPIDLEPVDEPDESEVVDGEGDEPAPIIDGQEPYCGDDLRLVAAVAHPISASWSVAAISAEGATRLFRVGQEAGGKEVLRIEGQQVTLQNGANACRLVMFSDEEPPPRRVAAREEANDEEEEPSRRLRGRNEGAITSDAMEAGITRVSENNYNIERSLVDTVLENQQELLRAARIIPHEENGQVVGVKMYGIRRNNLLGRLGVQNGDMLRTINGFDMASPDSALEAYARLRDSDHLTLNVVRRGQPMTIDYNIQ